jgi:hypothetical protein
MVRPYKYEINASSLSTLKIKCFQLNYITQEITRGEGIRHINPTNR